VVHGGEEGFIKGEGAACGLKEERLAPSKRPNWCACVTTMRGKTKKKSMVRWITLKGFFSA